MPDNAFIEIAGLWDSTSAAGREYLGGKTREEVTIPAGSYVMVWPNASDNPKAPAFRAVYSLPREDQAPREPRTGAFGKLRGTAAPQPAVEEEDDIGGEVPF